MEQSPDEVVAALAQLQEDLGLSNRTVWTACQNAIEAYTRMQARVGQLERRRSQAQRVLRALYPGLEPPRRGEMAPRPAWQTKRKGG